MSALGRTAYPDKSNKIGVIVMVCVLHNANAQQTRNHFWTSWHVSYWFIIGTAPPVRVFVCIHVNTCVLPLSWIFNEFDMSRTGLELVRFQWYVRVITWKNLWFLNLNLNGIRRKEANSGYYIRRGCVRMLLSVWAAGQATEISYGFSLDLRLV